jgi:hypothetical protein
MNSTDPIEEMIGAHDPWSWWKAALAGKRAPIDPNSPEWGFYRTRINNVWVPIAYWWTDGEMQCLVGVDQAFHRSYEEHVRLAIEKWPYISKHPITQEVYDAVIGGGQWPDLDEAVAEQMQAGTARGIGDNRAPVTEAEQIKIDVEDAAKAVDRYKVIEDDETNTKAQSARARLNELAGKADKKREIEKAPSLKEGRDIDAKWNAVITTAKGAAETIRTAMRVWENKKFQEQQRLRLEEESRLRHEQEEEQRAADAAIAQGVPPAAQQYHPAAGSPPAPPAPPVRAVIKGGYGRAASVPTITVYKVADQDALYAAAKTEAEVVEFFKGFAKRTGKAGRVFPGVTATQEKDVR